MAPKSRHTEENSIGCLTLALKPWKTLFEALSLWKRMFRVLKVHLFLIDIHRLAVVAETLQRFFQMSTELSGAFFKSFASTAATSAVLAIQHQIKRRLLRQLW